MFKGMFLWRGFSKRIKWGGLSLPIVIGFFSENDWPYTVTLTTTGMLVPFAYTAWIVKIY
jgi:hypothetical protein